MRILLLFSFILIFPSCSTVQVVKEVSKATSSIKASVENIVSMNKTKKDKTVNDLNENNETSIEINSSIDKEKAILEVEKKKEKNLVKEQKKLVKIDFLNQTLVEIKLKLGQEELLRIDGNTSIVRFDKKSCRLFFFFNLQDIKPQVEHFEIRDINGDLIISKKEVQSCYKDFDLI